MIAKDDDDIREAIEAVTWNDVEGLPMSFRIGLRAAPSANTDVWKHQIETALELHVKHLECDDSDGNLAPTRENLINYLKQRGIDFNEMEGNDKD